MKKIAILNGPNLDRLGKREPHIYGSTTLAQLEEQLKQEFSGTAELEFYQSNHEGDLIDKIAALSDAAVSGIVINAGGLTHTSVSLRDAIASTTVPVIEVHISNIHSREAFRHESLLTPVCIGIIAGLGMSGYSAATRYLVER